MNEEERISRPEHLDAVLARDELNAREALLRRAQGRNFRWPDAVMGFGAAAALLSGLHDIHVEQDIDGVVAMAAGVLLSCGVLHLQHERRIEALTELVRRTTTGADATR